MALELRDRIYTDCVSTGTDDAWIGETKEGYQGWEAITPNATVYYCITDDTSWEIGYGNYVNAFGAGDEATKAIKRNLLSSSTGSLLNLSGNASIFLTYPSEKAVILNTDGNIQLPNSNVRFKTITGDTEVISPAIVTEAVIVDGTAGTEGDLAKLLNVYTKDEIHEIRETQNEENTAKFMGKVGGTFTGEVKHKKDIFIEPTMPNRFVNITNRYATNPDGSPAGADGTAFGINFDLDHGNSGYNQVKFSNRDGNILAVNGGINPAVKYSGRITEDLHIVTKGYVDANTQHLSTLHVRESTYSENTEFGTPTEFFANTGRTDNTTMLKFKQAYNNSNVLVDVTDFKHSKASRVKVYERATADLMYDGIVKAITLDSGFAKVTCLPIFTAVNHDWLRTANKYTFILENIVEDK